VTAIEFRDLKTTEDLARVVELEKRIWGYTNGDDVVPLPILAVTAHRGAVLVGAFAGDEMVGFVYSIPAIRAGRLSHWSHMMGVAAPYRGSGLGHQLKVVQRERALALGIDLVEWTYDPLLALNAHLNFAKLGVVVEEYEVNIYGPSSSPLHGDLPTDRFIAQWWIRTPRVEARLAGRRRRGARECRETRGTLGGVSRGRPRVRRRSAAGSRADRLPRHARRRARPRA
jgi:predicted GNAT superfamily acetyltransferase